MQGIDVSMFQGSIDFAKVKASGIDFVIIRAGYGREISQKDPYFEKNYAGAKAAGLNVGAYWYSYADSVEDVKKEAAACLEAIKGKKFEYPIYFDIEETKQFKRGKDFCSGLVKTFCDALEKAGYFAGFYASTYYLNKYFTPEVKNRYTVWAAEYAGTLHYTGGAGAWQYTSFGRVNGISGRVDRDISYKDFPAIIKKAGLNGYKKATSDGSNSSKAAPVTYTVKAGDTLTAIAKRYKSTVAKIVKANSIKDANKIYVGQVIKIP